MITSLLFDFGNTLVSTELDWEVIIDQNITNLLNYLESVGIKVDKESFGKTFLQIRQENFKKADKELWEYTAEQSLSQTFAQLGIPNVSQQVLENGVDAFFATELNLYPVFPDVPEVLAELKQRGFKMAIVSNATSGRLIRKAVSDRDLTKYFETVIVSADIGYRKPHPKIFQLALDQLNAQPQETVMVGDLLEIDILGAQQLGMKTILAQFVKPNEEYNGKKSAVVPDAVATQVKDILTYIKAL